MSAFFNEQSKLVQFALRIIMNKKPLIVKRPVTQKPLKSIQGRSLILDIDAVDEDGTEIDVEVQAENSGAHSKRARLHSSMLDSNALVQNEDFTKLPETYVIFIHTLIFHSLSPYTFIFLFFFHHFLKFTVFSGIFIRLTENINSCLIQFRFILHDNIVFFINFLIEWTHMTKKFSNVPYSVSPYVLLL